MGEFTVDFLCLASRLIVEVDGRQHAWEAGYDDRRTRTLESMGFSVVRFTNEEVRDGLPAVLERIAAALRPV
jgi:very-short-patch-repair endonuclease